MRAVEQITSEPIEIQEATPSVPVRCAVVDADGNVVNMIVADPLDTPPEGCTLQPIPVDLPVDQTWTSEDGEFIQDPEP